MRVASRINYLFVIVALTLAGCSDGFRFPGQPDPDKRFVRPDQVEDFEALFKQNCRGCHGDGGQNGPAPPLNDPLFLAIISNEQLRTVITQGRNGYLMPAFGADNGGHLTTKQIDILAAGIRQRWAAPIAQPKEPLPIYSVSEAAKNGPAGNPQDGAKVFASACSNCHGDNGSGGSIGAINSPDFLALLSDQSLRRIVITGRPDLKMPDYASSDGVNRPADFKPLTAKDIADVVALMASWRRAAK